VPVQGVFKLGEDGFAGPASRERTANADFANRSTARRARTIITRKFGTGVLLPVALRLYFLSRSTARGARTIMARKSGISVLPRVTFWLYFRSSVRSFDQAVQPTDDPSTLTKSPSGDK